MIWHASLPIVSASSRERGKERDAKEKKTSRNDLLRSSCIRKFANRAVSRNYRCTCNSCRSKLYAMCKTKHTHAHTYTHILEIYIFIKDERDERIEFALCVIFGASSDCHRGSKVNSLTVVERHEKLE